MNPRTSLTLFGIIIIVLGVIPLTTKLAFFPASLKNIPAAGSIVYQAVLIVIGILALMLSGKKKQPQQQIIMQR